MASPGTGDDAADDLARAVTGLQRGHLVVVTGAGVSLASGIPTFRGADPGAVWAGDVLEMATLAHFERDPAGSWLWYLQRFDRVLQCRPNAAHAALVALERWHLARPARFTLVTQNIDTLHEEAGSRHLIKVHGSAAQVRCSRRGCELGAPRGALSRDAPAVAAAIEAFRAQPDVDHVPRCPSCGAWLRQHVLWFDEFYDDHASYQWQAVLAAAAGADLVLFVGTSFAVGVTDLFLRAVIERRVPAFAIDPAGRAAPHPRVNMLNAAAEKLLPAVCARLGAA